VLDRGDGLGVVALRAAGGVAVEAWHDSLANEARILAAVYSNGSWHDAAALANGYGLLDGIAIDPTAARFVRWRTWGPGRAVFVEAIRRGLSWGRATEVAAPGERAGIYPPRVQGGVVGALGTESPIARLPTTLPFVARLWPWRERPTAGGGDCPPVDGLRLRQVASR
jgi:hypothetical protein